jgi:hypothetical protein
VNWSALGHDPAPGDVEAVHRLAGSFGSVADRSEDVLAALRRIDEASGPAVWRGPAADDFRRVLADVGPGLTKLSGSYRAAQQAATRYATALGDAQERARRAETDAERALADKSTAEGQRRSAAGDADTHAAARRAARLRIVEAEALRITTTALGDPGYASSIAAYEQRMRDRYTHAQTAEAEARRREKSADDAVHAADQRVGQARRLGDDAADDHSRAKDAFVRALRDAGDASGVSPDLVRRIWHDMQHSLSVQLDPLTFDLGKKSWHRKDPEHPDDPKKTKWYAEKYVRDHHLDPEQEREYYSLLSASAGSSDSAFDAEASGSNGWASGSAGVKAWGYDLDAQASVGMFDDGSYGAAAGLSGSAYLLSGNAKGRLGSDRFGVEGNVQGQVGARGKIGADIGFGKDKVRATVGADGFVGAEIGGDVGVDIGGVKPTVGGHLQAGVGATAKADIGYSKGKFTIDGELGASLGLGGSIDGSVEIDIPKVADTVGDAGKAAFGFAKKSIGSIPKPW